MRALFDFKARSKVELDLTKDHTYLLLRPCDLDGNHDWWLLSDPNKDGGVVGEVGGVDGGASVGGVVGGNGGEGGGSGGGGREGKVVGSGNENTDKLLLLHGGLKDVAGVSLGRIGYSPSKYVTLV